MDDNFVLEYTDLPITISYKVEDEQYLPNEGMWLPAEYDTEERYVDYNYEVPFDDVVSALGELMSDDGDLFAENASDEEFKEYVVKNFKSLFNRYEKRLLEYFKDAAIEEAELKFETEDLQESMNEDIEKHDTLNPKLWNEDETLKEEVREKIMEIVKEFTDGLKEDGIEFKLDDVKLVGSNCSYNYNEDSDLDIHLVMDTDSLVCPENLYPLLYSAYRSIWNKNHDITFYDIPVEIFVETSDTKQMNDTEKLKEDLELATPYMLRNDGSIFECSPMHPYIMRYYEKDDIVDLLQNKDAEKISSLDWFYKYTNNDKLKEDIDIIRKYFNISDSDVYQSSKSEILDFIIEANNLSNQEFLRLRTSNLLYGGTSNSLYARISSIDFNWYPLLFNLMTKHVDIQDITICKDSNTFGGRFDAYDINGVKCNHLSRDEFLTLKGNPIVESLESEFDIINSARKCLQEGKFVTEAYSHLHPRYVNGWYRREIIESLDHNIKYSQYPDKTINEEREQTALKSNGVYSVLNNTWIKKPEKSEIPDIDMEEFEKEFKVWEDRYLKIVEDEDILTESTLNEVYPNKGESKEDFITRFMRATKKEYPSRKQRYAVALSYWDRGLKESIEDNSKIKEIEDFIKDVYDLRKKSIANEGEYGIGNLVFKELRSRGYLDKLKELKSRLISDELSLK